MSSFVESLNLRPQEKRLIVGIGLVAFVVLNWLFVLPHFKDYSRMQYELAQTLKTNADFTKKIIMDNNPTNGFKVHLDELRKGGSDVSTVKFSSAIQLQNTISRRAQEAGVYVSAYDPYNLVHLGTNAAAKFFESTSFRITVEGTEDSLVNFLFNVGNDPAMIRVRELSLKPKDQNRYRLGGMITLTADYKKDDPAAVAAAKPATPPPQKTAAITPPSPPARGAVPPVPPNGRGPAVTNNNRGAGGQRAGGPNGRGPNTQATPPPLVIPSRRSSGAMPTPPVPGQ